MLCWGHLSRTAGAEMDMGGGPWWALCWGLPDRMVGAGAGMGRARLQGITGAGVGHGPGACWGSLVGQLKYLDHAPTFTIKV